jgi:hypothetical protein
LNVDFSLGHILSIQLGLLYLLATAILLISYRSNKYVNIYLIVMLIAVSVKMLYTGTMSDGSDIFMKKSFLVVRLSMLLGVASTYLYVKALVNDEKYVSPQVLYHAVIPVFWSVLFILQSHYVFIPEAFWLAIRKFFMASYVSFYLVISIVYLKQFYKNNIQDDIKATHFNSVKNWVSVFFIFAVLVTLRSLFHFCFNYENRSGLLSEASFYIALGLLFLIILKIFTTPEILFGYGKIKKTISSKTEGNHRIVFLNNQYFIHNKPIHDYFEGKILECIMILLNNNNEFVNLINLDDVFRSEERISVAAVKKRREHCIKEIKYILSFRLDVPVDSIFIESRDEIDKRIKLIKINPELLSI